MAAETAPRREVAAETVPTRTYDGQKAGTSGLRKKVAVFQQAGYTENFLQAIMDAVPGSVRDATLVVGGDGRYYNDAVMQLIAGIAAGNGVKKLIFGRDGLLSTPATSHVIRSRRATGGILLTASHNPGGPDADFGIKLNLAGGEPAPEAVTTRIYEETQKMTCYRIVQLGPVCLSSVGSKMYGDLEVEVIDSVSDYVEMLKDIFDFDLIRSFLHSNPDFKVLFDGLHGVTGPYGKAIFIRELDLPASSVQNCDPLPDFGGGHPDPNLVYAHSLVEAVEARNIQFGAASDGDGDRNMIYGKDVIPYFRKTGVKGLARSMPTSAALDLVAKKKNLNMYEVPTGWKFFCSLFDSDRLSICGEESFGTGSDHIREKDGVWAVVAWLNIIASVAIKNPQKASISAILDDFWSIYGRTFFSRHDYEEVDTGDANKVMIAFGAKVVTNREQLAGSSLAPGYKVIESGDFDYRDPVDGSVSSHQGIYIKFENGCRVVVRLSGTGSSGATIRIYFEKYESDRSKFHMDAQEALKELIALTLNLLRLTEFTGRTAPTVTT